ncbi:MAG: GNAT family N-acetyltransferase [Oscillospiraceae bacterium]|nr:GNAT family N-acetyltransferase [Oscillospiraceae bacterium]
MELKTERLILREFALDDKHNLYKLFSEKFVSTYEHLQMKNISDVESYIKFHMENAKSSNRTHYYYVMELQKTREFIGSIGYSFVEETMINGISGWVMELEYYLLEEHWNKGYMTEALRKIISSAFEKDNILKIFAQCRKDNVKSENVMIKCGMYKSAKQPEHKMYNGVLKEPVRYELTADSYVRV